MRQKRFPEQVRRVCRYCAGCYPCFDGRTSASSDSDRESGSEAEGASSSADGEASAPEEEWSRLWRSVDVPLQRSGTCVLSSSSPAAAMPEQPELLALAHRIPPPGPPLLAFASSPASTAGSPLAALGGCPVPSAAASPLGTVAALQPQLTRALSPLGAEFLQLADAVPDIVASNFLCTEPIFSRQLPGLTLERLRRIVHAEPFIMERCLRQDLEAYDMRPSRWHQGKSCPGTLIRGLKYKTPVPKAIPAAVRSVVTMPEFCSCLTFCRLRVDPAELVLTCQTITEGMPLADSARLQVTNTFTPYKDGSGGGVTFRRWIVVAWLKELPWTLRFVKACVLASTIQGGKD